ncbi:MAG: cytochrome c nitrite reductase small subunit [Pirellulaceae bacterium]|nr:cytochrome c nitrite reductase small subunit [Pirellulaceae bacterium]
MSDLSPESVVRNARGHWRWQVWLLACALGSMIGLGGFTFEYGGGASYLSNDPVACKNCHIMQGHFDSWQKSSHHAVATCNDCHLPHDFLGKWFTKADNGLLHSWAFTTGDFHEPIQIKPRNRLVTQGACLHCHRELVHHMLPTGPYADMLDCIHCHAAVGHAHR